MYFLLQVIIQRASKCRFERIPSKNSRSTSRLSLGEFRFCLRYLGHASATTASANSIAALVVAAFPLFIHRDSAFITVAAIVRGPVWFVGLNVGCALDVDQPRVVESLVPHRVVFSTTAKS